MFLLAWRFYYCLPLFHFIIPCCIRSATARKRKRFIKSFLRCSSTSTNRTVQQTCGGGMEWLDLNIALQKSLPVVTKASILIHVVGNCCVAGKRRNFLDKNDFPAMMSQRIDSLLSLGTSCWMLRFDRRIDTETPDETAVMRDTSRAPAKYFNN